LPGRVSGLREMRHAREISVGNLKKKIPFGDLGVNGKIILKDR